MKPLKKRSFGVIAAFLAFGLTLAACSPEEDSSGGSGESTGDSADAYQAILDSGPVAEDSVVEANEWASSVREAGVLAVGGTRTSELFSLEDPSTGEVRGFDAALSQLLSKYILGDVNTELTQVAVDTREELLISNDVDVVFATYSITPEREERIQFAGPYFNVQYGVLIASSTDDIEGVEDLAGKVVTTQANSTGETVVEEFAPDAELRPLPDHAQALQAVQQGSVDAYVVDYSLLLNAVVGNNDVEIVGEPFGPSDVYGIGLNRENDAREFVNEWLQQIIDDGTWAELWQLTIGDRTGVEEIPDPPSITH